MFAAHTNTFDVFCFEFFEFLNLKNSMAMALQRCQCHPTSLWTWPSTNLPAISLLRRHNRGLSDNYCTREKKIFILNEWPYAIPMEYTIYAKHFDRIFFQYHGKSNGVHRKASGLFMTRNCCLWTTSWRNVYNGMTEIDAKKWNKYSPQMKEENWVIDDVII